MKLTYKEFDLNSFLSQVSQCLCFSGIFIGLAFVLVLTSLFIHIYTFTNVTTWESSLEDYT